MANSTTGDIHKVMATSTTSDIHKAATWSIGLRQEYPRCKRPRRYNT